MGNANGKSYLVTYKSGGPTGQVPLLVTTNAAEAYRLARSLHDHYGHAPDGGGRVHDGHHPSVAYACQTLGCGASGYEGVRVTIFVLGVPAVVLGPAEWPQ